VTDIKDDGGPAFPPHHNPATHEYGMSLRDWFAGQAINGMLAGRGGPVHPHLFYVDADIAYQIADAMLEARKGGAP
jgi:hypothetical protein